MADSLSSNGWSAGAAESSAPAARSTRSAESSAAELFSIVIVFRKLVKALVVMLCQCTERFLLFLMHLLVVALRKSSFDVSFFVLLVLKKRRKSRQLGRQLALSQVDALLFSHETIKVRSLPHDGAHNVREKSSTVLLLA